MPRSRIRPPVAVVFERLLEKELSAPDTKAGKIQRACLELLREHQRAGTLLTNVRFLFYELEQRGIVPKHYDDLVHQPASEVTRATARLREIGLVPWDWLVDETRNVSKWQFAASVFEYASEAVEYARIDYWDGEPAPLIICESRATSGVLKQMASRYLAPITGTGGQAGGFLVHQGRSAAHPTAPAAFAEFWTASAAADGAARDITIQFKDAEPPFYAITKVQLVEHMPESIDFNPKAHAPGYIPGRLHPVVAELREIRRTLAGSWRGIVAGFFVVAAFVLVTDLISSALRTLWKLFNP